MIEIVSPRTSAARARAVIFDFDGTLSLIRSGWMDVMIPMCVEQLQATGTRETPETLRAVAEAFVWRLTGKETIYQMMALAEAVAARGGKPEEPRVYKKRYLDRLHEKIADRLEALESGHAAPDRFLVPGAHQLVESLAERGLALYLASGTDHGHVQHEAKLLKLATYFGEHVYGAQEDLTRFSKALLVQQIVSQAGFAGDELLVFGDGYVEIEEVKKVGGVAVGVATSEPECLQIDEWKRERLIRVGADFIVPHFLGREELFDAVFGERVAAHS